MDINAVLNSELFNEYIRKDYLDYKNISLIKKNFLNNTPKSIKLDSFFTDKKYQILKNEIVSQKFKKDSDILSHLYSKSEISKDFNKLIYSEEFKTFVKFLTNKDVTSIDAKSISLNHKSYSLLKDDFDYNFLDVNFFLSSWNEEFGGYFSYFKDEELLRILPTENSVIFVYLEYGIQKFIKYVNVNSCINKLYFTNCIIR